MPHKIHIYGRYMGDIKAVWKILSEDQDFDVSYDFYNTNIKKLPEKKVDYIVTSNQDPTYLKAPNIHIGHGAGCVAKLYHNNKKEFMDDYGKYYALGFYGEKDKQTHINMGFPEERILVFGMPQSVELLEKENPILRDTWLINKKLDPKKKTILYAPTWNQGSSRGFFPIWDDENTKVKLLCDKIQELNLNFVIRMHERHRYTKDWLKLYSNIFDNYNINYIYLNDDPDNTPYLKYSDILIGDMSSMNSYFYTMNKPVIHIGSDIMKSKRNQGQGGWELEDRAGYVTDFFDELLTYIEDSVKNPKRFENQRKKVVAKYINATGKEAKELILQEFKRICK